jgi:anti-sigma B factor antagonist
MTHLDVELHDDVPVARPRGDIDAANAAALHDELAACVGPHVDELVLDLSDTRYVDSAGIDTLLRLSERLQQRRAAIVLVIPPDSPLMRLAEIVGLPRAIPVHDSVERAVGACAHRGA